jgi:hypothetical protein
MEAGDGLDGADVLSAVEWSPETAELTNGYRPLEIVTAGGLVIPVVPVCLDLETLVVGLPSEFVPWLQPSLVRVADVTDRSQAAPDGRAVAVALVRLSSMGAAFPLEATSLRRA